MTAALGRSTRAFFLVSLFYIVFASTISAEAQVLKALGQTQRIRLYKMSRPEIRVTLRIRGHKIVYLNVLARVRCESLPRIGPHRVERFKGYGGFGIRNSGTIPIRPDGRFNHRSGGGGKLEFAGRVEKKRVFGRFRDWYEIRSRADEEEVPTPPSEHESYRCGTNAPHGYPIHFVADQLR